MDPGDKHRDDQGILCSATAPGDVVLQGRCPEDTSPCPPLRLPHPPAQGRHGGRICHRSSISSPNCRRARPLLTSPSSSRPSCKTLHPGSTPPHPCAATSPLSKRIPWSMQGQQPLPPVLCRHSPCNGRKRVHRRPSRRPRWLQRQRLVCRTGLRRSPQPQTRTRRRLRNRQPLASRSPVLRAPRLPPRRSMWRCCLPRPGQPRIQPLPILQARRRSTRPT